MRVFSGGTDPLQDLLGSGGSLASENREVGESSVVAYIQLAGSGRSWAPENREV